MQAKEKEKSKDKEKDKAKEKAKEREKEKDKEKDKVKAKKAEDPKARGAACRLRVSFLFLPGTTFDPVA